MLPILSNQKRQFSQLGTVFLSLKLQFSKQMRTSFFLLTALLFISYSRSYGQDLSYPLVFEERVFDFGTIQEKDGLVSHTFYFKNTGNTPVIINDIRSGCGCISSDYAKAPIKPGERSKITVNYNPAYRPGFFSKEVVILSNSNKNTNRVWVKGSVAASDHPVEEDYPYAWGNGLYTNLKVLSIGSIAVGKSKEIELRFANDSDKLMDLRFVTEGKNPQISFVNPGKLKAKERGKIIVRYTMTHSKEKEIITHIFPVIDGKKLSTYIQVKAICTQ